MTVNSNRKGKRYERHVARILRAIYPNAKRGNQDNMVNTEADVEGTPFRIECKDRSKIGIFRFWEQAQKEQSLHGDDRPILLIFKEKRSHSLAAVDLELFCAMLDAINSLGCTDILELHAETKGRKGGQSVTG